MWRRGFSSSTLRNNSAARQLSTNVAPVRTAVYARCVMPSSTYRLYSVAGATTQDPARFTQRETYTQSLKPVEESHSLLPEAYYDPGFYQLEKERLWSKVWVAAGYTTDIPKPGDTKVVDIAGNSIILSRGKKGELNAFYNVCRHRGSTVVQADGNYKTYTCPYHCWSYGLDGKLLGASMFNKAREDKLERNDPTMGLYPVQIDNWGPFIFVNLNANNTVSLKQYLGDLPSKYSRYITDPEGKPVEWQLAKTKQYTAMSNWKNVGENFNDWYHVPWVHQTLAPTSEVSNHVILQGPGMYMGFGTVPLSPGGSPADATFMPALPYLNATERASAIFLHIFPNISLFFLPHHTLALMGLPRGPEETHESLDLFMNPEVLKATPDSERDLRVNAVFDFWDKVNLEDVEATERVQRGQRMSIYKGGPFSQFEVMIHRMQRMLIECVTHNWPTNKQLPTKAVHLTEENHEANPALKAAPFAHFYDPAVCKEAHRYNDMRHVH